MKVFISIPMRDRTHEEIRSEMDSIMESLRAHLHPITVEQIDSLVECPRSKNEGVACLGKSISLMSEADLIVFAPGWSNSRGCAIEYEVALEYHIDFIFSGPEKMIETQIESLNLKEETP